MTYMAYHGTKNNQLKRKYKKMMVDIMNAEVKHHSTDEEDAEPDNEGSDEPASGGLEGDDDEEFPPLIGV
jgi:hypothetical protein